MPDESELCLCHGVPTDTGLPIIDTTGIEEDVIKEKSRFQLIRSGNVVGVLFDPSRRPTRCLTVDRARFLLADDLWVGICYGPLSEEELALIDESFRAAAGRRND